MEKVRPDEESGSEIAQEEKKGKISGGIRLKKENFIVILLLGILLLVMAWPVAEEKSASGIWSGLSDNQNDTLKENNSNVICTEEGREREAYVTNLEAALEALLCTMEGAGKVKVMITLSDMGQAVVEKDVTTQIGGTTQVDQAGSNNTSDRHEVGETVFENAGSGISFPYVKQRISPQIAGVVVSVQGGDNLRVNKNITEAIQALFGIDVHKIKIIKMSSNS